ncbi:hypothetical protein pb186bvf_005180 [Paramecium bursaria]
MDVILSLNSLYEIYMIIQYIQELYSQLFIQLLQSGQKFGQLILKFNQNQVKFPLFP